MRAKLKQALRRLGYRHMGKGAWGKPVAYHLLVVKLEKGEAVFCNYFIGARDQLLLWHSIPLGEDDHYDTLRSLEFSTDLSVGQPHTKARADFGFLTPEDRAACVLEDD